MSSLCLIKYELNIDVCLFCKLMISCVISLQKSFAHFLQQKHWSEFNELESLLKSAKNRFQMSAGLNLNKFNTILSGTNHI